MATFPLRARMSTASKQFRTRLEPAAARMGPILGPMRVVIDPVTSLGWLLLAIGLGAWYLGVRLQWEELLILAGACLVALVVSLLLTLGRLGLEIDVDVNPRRVMAGDPEADAVGVVRVVNDSGRPSLGARVEVPVGQRVVGFDIGALAAGSTFEEPFIIETRRRSIIPIGQARSVKGDPLGIARREVAAGSQVLLYVHPRTIALPSITAGWLRDLEGQTTNDLSTSDVAFHTLREYAPGDDRRHIHWRTTARLGTMMVRQFVDTRRSHLGLVLATGQADWLDEDEFELGVSVVGSLGRTALRAEQEVTTVSGARPIGSHTSDMLLDGLAGIDWEPNGLDVQDLVLRSLRFTHSVSVLALVVGSTLDPRTIRMACSRYPKDTTVVAIRCARGAEPARRRIANISLVDLGGLQDLARILATSGSM